MNDPLRRLKFLPWRSLFQVAAITAAIVIFLDVLLILGYTHLLALKQSLSLLYSPPLGLLVTFAVAIGVGALAVYLLEKLCKLVTINSANLWALILCLAVVFVIKSLLPIPALLFSLDQLGLIGIILGVFWKGRRYWR